MESKWQIEIKEKNYAATEESTETKFLWKIVELYFFSIPFEMLTD